MYIYIYIYMHIFAHTRVSRCAGAFYKRHASMSIYRCIYTYMYMCAYVCVCVYMYVCVCVCVSALCAQGLQWCWRIQKES